jgi:hypothetical protein
MTAAAMVDRLSIAIPPSVTRARSPRAAGPDHFVTKPEKVGY